MIISLINGWFKDNLFDRLFVLSLLIDIAIIISYIACLISLVMSMRNKKDLNNFITLGILIITISIALFLPFRICIKKVELKLYE